MGLRSTLLAAAFLISATLPSQAAEAKKDTLAFVVRDWFTAVYEGRFMDECPEGLNVANDEVWWRGLTKKDRAKLTDNGLIQNLNRSGIAMRRGAHGEDVCLNPDSLAKPDPEFRTIEGKISYGANLDGTADGKATSRTCGHEKFTAPDGTAGIDNQLYRLVGCTYGWRKGGLVDLNANELRGTSGLGMILIEVTGVKDPRNSDDVTITFYRSIDQFSLDSTGKVLPFSSYRIDIGDDGKPRYADSVKGAIKDGVLTTKRADIILPFYGQYMFMHPVIKDMGLKLEIAPDGRTASGMVTGYYDVAQYIHWVGSMGATIPISYFSCPAIAAAAKKLADGYPDPKTGECTAISSAFKINTFAAYVVHPKTVGRQASK
jgi:hypothetical protein